MERIWERMAQETCPNWADAWEIRAAAIEEQRLREEQAMFGAYSPWAWEIAE
jgi:hypothetical protein